jgi:hypothetical protein
VPNAGVTLAPVQDGPRWATFRTAAQADAGGRFVFASVPEGTYVVQSGGEMFGQASAIVEAVAATEPRPVTLTLLPLPKVRGRVVFDGNPPPVVRNGESLGVVRFLPTGGSASFQVMTGSREVRPDGTFEVPGTGPSGMIRITLYPYIAGWIMSRVLYQGRDVTDALPDLQGGDLDGVEVVFTNRVGRITGTVLPDDPPTPVVVVVFGTEETGAAALRSMRLARPGPDGAFIVDGLVAGRYFVAAIQSSTARVDGELLRTLRGSATQVVVAERADTAVRLTLVK